MKLSQVSSGCYTVKNITADTKLRLRLRALNFYEGAQIEILGYSLFKRNTLILSEGVRLSFRRSFAERVSVERLE